MIWDFAIFTNIEVFLLLMIFIMSVIGAFSGSGVMAFISGYVTFVYVGAYSNVAFYTRSFYAIIVILAIIVGFQIFNLQGEGA